MDINTIKANLIEMMRGNGADNKVRTLIHVFTELGDTILDLPPAFRHNVKDFGQTPDGRVLRSIMFSIGYPAVGPHFRLDSDYMLLPTRKNQVAYDLFIPYNLIWLVENEGIPGGSFNLGVSSTITVNKDAVEQFEKAQPKPKLTVVADKDMPVAQPDGEKPELIVPREAIESRIGDPDEFFKRGLEVARKIDNAARGGDDQPSPRKPHLTIVK